MHVHSWRNGNKNTAVLSVSTTNLPASARCRPTAAEKGVSCRFAHVVSATRVCWGVVVSYIRFGFVRSTGPFLTRLPYALQQTWQSICLHSEITSEISSAKCFSIQHDQTSIYDSYGHFGHYCNMFCYQTSRYTRYHSGPLVLHEQQENKQRRCERKGTALVVSWCLESARWSGNWISLTSNPFRTLSTTFRSFIRPSAIRC